MKIEVLFPEFCNLNGDMGNIEYLKKCIPDAEIVETTINKEPAFVKENDISLIYMGTMSEKTQELVIDRLKPYKERIEKLIEDGQVFLFTGNSIEVFGKYIENEDETKIEGLGIFDIHSKRSMMKRHNSLFMGEYDGIDIIGFKSQFTMLYGNNEENYFIKVSKGIGFNPESKLEGIKKNNFFATNVIGPFLIMNPLFTQKLMRYMKNENSKLAFEEHILKAYQVRLERFKILEF